MYRSILRLLAIAATLGAAAAAEACVTAPPVSITGATAETLLCDFNVISNGNFTEGGPDVFGPLLIGGNLVSPSATLNSQNVVLGSTAGTTAIIGYGELNVFGNTTLSGGVIVGGNTVVLVGGTNTNPANTILNPAAGSHLSGYAFPGNFATDVWAKITGLSTGLSGLTSPSTFDTTTGVVHGVTNANGQAVFDVPLSALNAFKGTLSFTGCLSPTAVTCDAVINVEGAGTFTQAFTYPALTNAFATNVLWNFQNATNVSVMNNFWGSILAPNATVNSSGDVIGNVIGATVAPMAEIHTPTFDCSANLCAAMVGPPPSVPEPGSLAVFGSALASLASFVVLRRRRS